MCVPYFLSYVCWQFQHHPEIHHKEESKDCKEGEGDDDHLYPRDVILMVDCSIKAGSSVEQSDEREWEISNLHPPSWPWPADSVPEKQVAYKVTSGEEVKEDAGEALEEEEHDSL